MSPGFWREFSRQGRGLNPQSRGERPKTTRQNRVYKEEQLMATHETVRKMTDGQRSDIIATMVAAIPDLTFDEAQRGVIGNKGPFVADIRAVFERHRRKGVAYPAVGQTFELTLQPVRGKEMVRRFGYESRGWEFRGKDIIVPQTRRFKLVQVNYCRELEEIRTRLVEHGKVPEGQWITAFKAAYPEPDGLGPVGVADPSWVDPGGGASFPVVLTDGSLGFGWADGGRGARWRWLVEVSK